MATIGRLPKPHLVSKFTWSRKRAARLRQYMEDPSLYATNPLFGAGAEEVLCPPFRDSVSRARYVGLPDLPCCRVRIFSRLTFIFNIFFIFLWYVTFDLLVSFSLKYFVYQDFEFKIIQFLSKWSQF
jgi:hypothetical protein